MTAKQFYFPYFYEDKDFKSLISKFDLSTSFIFEPGIEYATALQIHSIKSSKEPINVPFWATFMVEEDHLVYWITKEDSAEFFYVDLLSLTAYAPFCIDISKLAFGEHEIEVPFKVDTLVTYIRKSTLSYDLPYFEKFVVLVLRHGKVTLEPFDWFNKTGGDYGYVWPALAQIDWSHCRLVGTGMRMSKFDVPLPMACR